MKLTDDELVDLLEQRLKNIADLPRFRGKLLSDQEPSPAAAYNELAQAVIDVTLGALDLKHRDKIEDALDVRLQSNIALLEWSQERRDRPEGPSG